MALGPRVIAGAAKGKRLATLPDETVRPTSDRVKESLFGMLEPWLGGATVVDLCAGIGTLGIEALSRGARFCTFVEATRRVREVLVQNLETLGFASRARVLPVSAPDGVRLLADEQAGGATVVLADPPYDNPALAAEIVEAVGRHRLLAPDGVLCLECAARTTAPPAPAGLEVWRERRYGRTRLVLYRPETAA